MSTLNSMRARRIIDTVGQNGIPPSYGFQFFTAGLDQYLSIIDDEYLSSFIKSGGSAFKIVVGVYGGGKTHFLYCVRDLAWKNNFLVSYVSLRPGESPFHKLELVYRAIVRGLEPPLTEDELYSGYEQGITNFIRRWYQDVYDEFSSKGLTGDSLNEELVNYIEQIAGIESISFTNAIKTAFKGILQKQEEEYMDICQWLNGEGFDRKKHSKHGILQRIDKTTAFSMIRSLSQWIKQIGFSGLIILLDEAERIPSLSTTQRELHLSNMRELIDECGQANFQGVMIFYAVPDESFLEGRTQMYEALRQRVATTFETLNPIGVKIELEKIIGEPHEFLCEVGKKLSDIYQKAYDYKFNGASLEETIELVAKTSYEERFGDIGYKRLFVQNTIKAFNYLRLTGKSPT